MASDNYALTWSPFTLVKLYGPSARPTEPERSLFHLYENQNSRLHLVDSGELQTEWLLMVALLGDQSDPRPVRQQRARELAQVGILLGNSVESEVFTTDSSIIAPDTGNTFSCTYGPDWLSRPTTWSSELQHILEILGLGKVLRVELCRRIIIPVGQRRPNLNHISALNRVVLFDRLFNRYDASFPGPAIRTNTLLPTNSPQQRSSKVSLMVFGDIRNDGVGSMADEVKLVSRDDNYAGPTILYPTLDADVWRYFLRESSYSSDSAAVKEMGFMHVAGCIETLCPQLMVKRQHISAFPFVEPRAICLGWYDVKSPPGQQSLGKCSERERILTVQVATRSFSGLGTPTVAGFYRAMDADVVNGSGLQNTMFSCQLGCVSGQAMESSRYGYGQYVVMLGNFSPSFTALDPPGMFADSGWEQNCTQTALNVFKSLYPGPCISGSRCPAHPASVLETLSTLIEKGGLLIFLSSLPPSITQPLLRGDAYDGENSLMSDYYKQCFLFASCTNLFLIINEASKVGGFTPLKALRRACLLADCPLHILGSTVPLEGINFVADVDNPVPTEDFTDDHAPVFTVPLLLPNKKAIRRHPGVATVTKAYNSPDGDDIEWSMLCLNSCLTQVLSHPTVGSKEHIVRHMDRCSNGLIALQPGVGPLDIPVADYGFVVSSSIYDEKQSDVLPYTAWDNAARMRRELEPGTALPTVKGTVMVLGEQGYKSMLSLDAGIKLSIVESVTNAAFAPVKRIEDLLLTLYLHLDEIETDKNDLGRLLAQTRAYCRELGVRLTIGSASSPRDAREMEFASQEATKFRTVVCSATAPAQFSGYLLTPALRGGGTVLIHVSVEDGPTIAGSILEQIFAGKPKIPTIPRVLRVRELFLAIKELMALGMVESGHDVSDGGVLVCAIEMALAGNRGIKISVPEDQDIMEEMFSEAPGVIFEVHRAHAERALKELQGRQLRAFQIGAVGEEGLDKLIEIYHGQKLLFRQSISLTRGTWSSFSIEQYNFLRPESVNTSMYAMDYGNPVITLKHPEEEFYTQPLNLVTHPDPRCRVAVLCCPGTSGSDPLMAAFTNVGCPCVRVLFREVKSEAFFDQFSGLVIGGACGAQDALTVSRGIVMTITKKSKLRDALLRFFQRKNTFSLAVGEIGCAIFTGLGIVGSITDYPHPGTPISLESAEVTLAQNVSTMYESRWLSFSIPPTTNAVMLRRLRGLILPCWIQGTYLGFNFLTPASPYILQERGLTAAHFHGSGSHPWNTAQHYPRNPAEANNVAALCSADGRHLAMLFNPSLCTQLWHWPHIPFQTRSHLLGSPWLLAFQEAHIWAVSQSTT
ncbi:ORF65 [callitrichine gammaherpesvirus 3]|uniref:ORF65 n=1 Tax=callitrichine gammaherpesvirus 3 TaxID=106331 RepID=Q8BEM8_9GAMA|nr:ORF65 [callitrichine gammaherpesvirus 3]AAN64289.1 ORF65 [callitrichine gammaherpesvirus 3]